MPMYSKQMTAHSVVPPIKTKESKELQRLMVAVRIRPLSQKEESAAAEKSIVAVIAKAVDDKTVMVYDPTEYFSGSRPREKVFEFDQVFGDSESQEKVFETCVKQQVDAVMSGYNATVFAYGATGAGKTYTMMGVEDNPGIMGRTLNHLFDKIATVQSNGTYKVSISYLEIYNEKIRDLLTGKLDNLDLQEDPSKGVIVSGITYMSAANPEAILGLLRRGNKNRIQEATGQNETSSRSHAILQIYVAFRSKESKSQNRFAKLSLCDLAGSERAAETNNRGMRMIEGANINRSLLALGNCINSLIEPGKKEYVNYRDSKLTRLLKDSLGGNCKTVMIANVSPSVTNFDETMNTLKYASRARNIKNKVSQQPSESMIKSLQEFHDDLIKVKGDAINTLARNHSSESFSSLPQTTAAMLNHHSSSNHATKKSQIRSNVNFTELEESLQELFLKQLEIRATELDHEEFDANHLRKQNRYKYEISKLDKQFNQTKNEGKRKHIKAKAQKLQNELIRIQSLIAKNQMAKQVLARDAHAIDQKIFKIQEASSKVKEGHFAQFIKSEIKMHQMEMNGLGLELKNALGLKLARQKDLQLSRMSEILDQYQKISALQTRVILDNNIKIPDELQKSEQELQKFIKHYNEESSGVILEVPSGHDDRILMKDSSKISISLGRIASGLSKLLSKPRKETPSVLNGEEHLKHPSKFSKDPSQASLTISMVPSEMAHTKQHSNFFKDHSEASLKISMAPSEASSKVLPPIYPKESSALTLSTIDRGEKRANFGYLPSRVQKEASKISM